MQQSYNKAQFEYRRVDTRRKIEFGGLVIKAGLEAETKDVILGVLLAAKEEINHESGARELYQSKGKRAFLNLD